MLGLAKRTHARFLLTSTSEVSLITVLTTTAVTLCRLDDLHDQWTLEEGASSVQNVGGMK